MTEQAKDETVDLVMAYFETFERRLFDGFRHPGDPEILTVQQLRRETHSRHAVAAQLTQAVISAAGTTLPR